MTKARWCHLMEDNDSKLTEDELSLGWHFCPEWDGLLIGPGMGEEESCLCFPDKLRTETEIRNETDCNCGANPGWLF